MKKNVLFICYWGADDVLTQATVWPRLKVLEASAVVNRIFLVTMERGEQAVWKANTTELPEITHIPYYTGKGLLSKITDFIDLPLKLSAVVKGNNIDLVLAHGAPAGALAYKVWRKHKVPFYVSSFEPHADYMVESGVWQKLGLKYLFQKHWEGLQALHAAGLMPVSDGFAAFLTKAGVKPEKIRTVPSIVQQRDFHFDQVARDNVRADLGWTGACIGVYSGKYGGLYYEEEAFQIYQRCFEHIQEFRLLILSPQPKDEIVSQLQKYKIDPEKVFVASVAHSEVPGYLSAADFAFATYKTGPSKKFLSPVKVGEYWANGLPVLLTEEVGDDSEITRREGGGALFNLQQPGSLEQAIQKLQTIIKDRTHRQEIPKLAVRYRSPERIREAYEYFFNQLQGNR